MVINFKQSKEKTFPELSIEMQSIVRDWLNNFSESDSDITELEFERRSGFIPHEYNAGGLKVNVVRDEQYFVGSGSTLPGGAKKELERCIEYSLKVARETFIEHHLEDLSFLGIQNDKINYHDLYELGFGDLAEKLSEYEYENLSGDYSSTNHEIMVMFDGNDEFTVTLQHSVSDAPYHRTADFCKEWSVRAVTPKQLSKQLQAIQAEVEKVWL